MITEQFDLPILRWIAGNLRTPLGDAMMPVITFSMTARRPLAPI